MTYTNGAGHNNVEQLLQSIRSSIGDNPMRSQGRGLSGMTGASSPVRGQGDPRQQGAGNSDGAHGATMRSGVEALRADLMARHDTVRAEVTRPDMRPDTRPDLPIADDSAEFELPAIFKAQTTPTETSAERSHLLDRLSNVLLTTSDSASPAATETARAAEVRDSGRTIIRFEPAFTRDTRQTREPNNGERSAEGAGGEAQRTNGASGDQLDRITKDNDAVKRVMPTFFDTRMKMLGQPPAAPPVMDAPVETPEPAVATPPPVPHYEPHAVSPSLPMPSHALTVPGDAEMDSAMDDMAAHMLRPILREWLSENMPKIVERALRSEMTGGASPGPGTKPKT